MKRGFLHQGGRVGRSTQRWAAKSQVATRLCLLLLLALSGCATRATFPEPDDLTAGGSTINALVARGWEIAEPVSVEQASADTGLEGDDHSASDFQSWRSFTAKVAPGDELRPVVNNAGVGHAIFRDGLLLDLFIRVIF